MTDENRSSNTCPVCGDPWLDGMHKAVCMGPRTNDAPTGFSEVRCTLCGAARIRRPDGTPGACSLIGCKDPLHDARTEKRPQEAPTEPAKCWDCDKPSDMPAYCWACFREEQEAMRLSGAEEARLKTRPFDGAKAISLARTICVMTNNQSDVHEFALELRDLIADAPCSDNPMHESIDRLRRALGLPEGKVNDHGVIAAAVVRVAHLDQRVDYTQCEEARLVREWMLDHRDDITNSGWHKLVSIVGNPNEHRSDSVTTPKDKP